MNEKKLTELGWKEYGSLPDLGVDKIHIKVDTGAKTSAIHTVKQQVFKKDEIDWVRFTIAPIQKDDDSLMECEMPVKDKRTITSSNGQSSERVVIETRLILGQIEKNIELTLTCRKKMKFRMLLGRQAMTHMVVIPDKSHLTTLKRKKNT